jgi:periplasmic divalent cation tolerance protein
MSEPIQVFTTAGDKEEAQRIAKAIVEQRLAACVQVLGPIYSSYWWEDELETAEEYLCLMKADRRLYDELEAAIKEVHSYDTPEILAMPVVEGNPDYLQWLQDELKYGN